MNPNGASGALKALAVGDHGKLDELCSWLGAQEGVVDRYLPKDLRTAADAAAVPEGDGGLDVLLADLRERPDSMLAAFFAGASIQTVVELPGATLGPARELTPKAQSPTALEMWAGDGNTLTVLVTHPAQGRLGAIRTAAWLQTVLGALGLAAYVQSQTVSPVATCPGFGTAMFLGTGASEPDIVDKAAMLAPGRPPVGDLAELVGSKATESLLIDATARTPRDLAQHRLTMAARWLQVASSAVSTADALVALGIALETIAGDDAKGAVVERITKRAATFLAAGAPQDERADVYYEELKRAKRLYDLRSRAMHGQYDEWAADQSHGDAGRDELHRFVLDVALGFRRHARARNMRDLADFKKWWKRVEIEGVFA